MSKYKRIYKDGYSYFITIVTHRREPILIDNISLLRKSFALSHSSYQRKLSGIWQKRFYEHTIRDENDWLEKILYIKFNAVKHKLVDVWVDWEYSSFVKS